MTLYLAQYLTVEQRGLPHLDANGSDSFGVAAVVIHSRIEWAAALGSEAMHITPNLRVVYFASRFNEPNELKV